MSGKTRKLSIFVPKIDKTKAFVIDAKTSYRALVKAVEGKLGPLATGASEPWAIFVTPPGKLGENLGCLADVTDLTPYQTDKQLIKEAVEFVYVYKPRDDGKGEGPAARKSKKRAGTAGKLGRSSDSAGSRAGSRVGSRATSTSLESARKGSVLSASRSKRMTPRSRSQRGADKMVKVERADGTVHAFSEEEKAGIVSHINSMMTNAAASAEAGILFDELDPDSHDIFTAVGSGVLLCQLVNCLQADTIPAKRINIKKQLNKFQQNENLEVALDGLRQVGVKTVNIGAEDIRAGTAYHLILGVLWQIVRLDMVNAVLAAKDNLKFLDAAGVDVSGMVPEQILLMWVNYHLKKAGSKKVVRNFSKDISDSQAYLLLLHQLKRDVFNLGPLAEQDLTKRAELMLEEAHKEDLDKFINATDVVEGNSRLNFAFVANLFQYFQNEEIDEEDEEDEEESSDPELGAWKEDLAELAGELQRKAQEARDAEEKLQHLRDERERMRLEHEAEVAKLKEELEALALAEPESIETLELYEELEEAEREKVQLASKATGLMRRAADLTEKIDDAQEAGEEAERRKRDAEEQIRTTAREHRIRMRSMQRKLEETKREEQLLERELSMQEEELRRTKEEKEKIGKTYKQLSTQLEVATIDRIQTQAAKDKLDKQLFQAKRYLAEAKTDKKIKEKRKKELTTKVRKAKEELDTLGVLKKNIIADKRTLENKNKELAVLIEDEHKGVLKARAQRIALEEEVTILKDQLEEDEEYFMKQERELAVKQETHAKDQALLAARDLARKRITLEDRLAEVDEVATEAEKLKKEAKKAAIVTEQIDQERKAVTKKEAKAEEERAEVERKRRKLEKELRKAKRLISEKAKEYSTAEQSRRHEEKRAAAAAAKLAEEQHEAERALLEQQLVATERDEVEEELLDTEAQVAEVASAKAVLDAEVDALLDEKYEVEAQRRMLLQRAEEEFRTERKRIEEELKQDMQGIEEAKNAALSEVAQAEAAVEEEKGRRVKLAMETEAAEAAAREAKRKAVEASAIREAELAELSGLKEESAEAKAELAQLQEEARAAELAAEAARKAEADATRELEREQEEVERLKQLAEDRKREGEEKRRQLKGELAALEADLEEARKEAQRNKVKVASAEKSKGIDAEAEVLRQQRLAEKRIRQEGEREVRKVQSKTKSLEERLREMEAAIAAEKRASKRARDGSEEEEAEEVVEEELS